MKFVVILGAILVASAYAACPNMCSGHGSCGNDDICTCYNNWGNGDETGGDCSQRICPFERAWVDSPSASNIGHALAECAGRGLCDRETGECECFEGYAGMGCQRTTCPNDCSGHGTCEYLKELRDAGTATTDVGDTFKWTGAAATTDPFAHDLTYLWDMDKTMGCKCDPLWTDVDCSRRMCPRSNYALYNNFNTDPEVQTITISNYTAQHSQFALTFRSRLNEEFTTTMLDASTLADNYNTGGSINATKDLVENALEKLPNFVLKDVAVSIDYMVDQNTADGVYDTLHIYVTFAGDQTTGDQYQLECITRECTAGCYPVITTGIGEPVDTSCTVSQNFTASSSNIECSGRGTCNYENGICECYEGYTDEACGTQTALV